MQKASQLCRGAFLSAIQLLLVGQTAFLEFISVAAGTPAVFFMLCPLISLLADLVHIDPAILRHPMLKPPSLPCLSPGMAANMKSI